MKKNTRMIYIFLIGMILLSNLLFASNGEIQFALDYASYSDQDGSSILEIYYSVNRSYLTWKKQNDGNYTGTYEITTTLYSGEKAIFTNTMDLNDATKNTLSVKSNQNIPEQLMLKIPVGSYQLAVRVKDKFSDRIGKLQIPIEVKSYSSDSLEVSDIEIASYAIKSTSENKFTKFGLYDIIPYAQKEFSEELGEVTIYAEIYNLEKAENLTNTYTYWFEVLSLNNKIVKKYNKKTVDTPGAYSLIIDKFNIADFKSGIYYAKLNVIDNNNKQKAEVKKKIYFTGPADDAESNNLFADLLRNESEHEIDSMFSIIKCLMSNKEKKMFERSNLTGKQSFLINYWERNDTDPRTKINEYRITIEQRISYANTKYSTAMRAGVKTDQGRTIIKYGLPSEIEKHPSSTDSKPYEVWQYYSLEGGVMFVFYDPSGFSNYELLHSNKRGERHDENWESKIKGTIGF
ncbi:MAG: GWxTD domain-containing protein [Candidatus Marinimicrobia bacterium]|nr:GWxTD domain-containing protein [Candidatus Neomarinimicrobiota bacterium]